MGVDGARSVVRNLMGVEQEGDMTDQLWGVINLAVDTDFPDVRRQRNIGNDLADGEGGGMIIPQERVSSGEYLTRLYSDMSVGPETSADSVSAEAVAEKHRAKTKEREGKVNEKTIVKRAVELFQPFQFQTKKGIEVDWWAACSIDQKLQG